MQYVEQMLKNLLLTLLRYLFSSLGLNCCHCCITDLTFNCCNSVVAVQSSSHYISPALRKQGFLISSEFISI